MQLRVINYDKHGARESLFLFFIALIIHAFYLNIKLCSALIYKALLNRNTNLTINCVATFIRIYVRVAREVDRPISG